MKTQGNHNAYGYVYVKRSILPITRSKHTYMYTSCVTYTHDYMLTFF